MEEKTIIEEFRKLEQEFGSEKSRAIMDFILKYNELLTKNLATTSDLANLKADLLGRFNTIVLWFGGLLVGQAVLIITLLKLL